MLMRVRALVVGLVVAVLSVSPAAHASGDGEGIEYKYFTPRNEQRMRRAVKSLWFDESMLVAKGGITVVRDDELDRRGAVTDFGFDDGQREIRINDSGREIGTTILLELAHLYDWDYFTEEDRDEIVHAYCQHDPTHEWWGPVYEDEISESFMYGFVAAFADKRYREAHSMMTHQETRRVIRVIRRVGV